MEVVKIKRKVIKNSTYLMASMCIFSSLISNNHEIKKINNPVLNNKCLKFDYGISYPVRYTENDKFISKFTGTSIRDVKKVNDIIDMKCKKYKVDKKFIQAICIVESDYKYNCLGPNTKYGRAKGIMQLMPELMKDYKVNNPFDLNEHIDAGVRFVKFLENRYKGKNFYDQNNKLIPKNYIISMAFNWGFVNLEKHYKKNECIVIAKTKISIPLETYNYILKIKRLC